MVDGQTFLADWEEAAKLPKKLTTAAPHENRKVSDVLADHVESADVIVIAISAISSEIKRDREVRVRVRVRVGLGGLRPQP